jgi:hypothetical protein
MGRGPTFIVGLFLRRKYVMLYCLYTFADITATGQHHGGQKLERNQQQNFDTVMQTIQLSGNMYYEKKPELVAATLFGNPDIKCWYFEWEMEIPNLFKKDNDPIGILKDQFEFVPYISGLTESVTFTPSVFRLGHNIIFDSKQ